jgi:hypothetical protein
MKFMLRKFLVWVGWFKQPKQETEPSLEKLKYLANYRPNPELRKELGMPDISKMMEALTEKSVTDSLKESIYMINWNNVSDETMKKAIELAQEDIRKNSEKNIKDIVPAPYLTTIK